MSPNAIISSYVNKPSVVPATTNSCVGRSAKIIFAIENNTLNLLIFLASPYPLLPSNTSETGKSKNRFTKYNDRKNPKALENTQQIIGPINPNIGKVIIPNK